MDYEQIYLDIVSGVLSKELFVCDMENHDEYLEDHYYQQGKDVGYERGYDSGRDDGYEQGCNDHSGH